MNHIKYKKGKSVFLISKFEDWNDESTDEESDYEDDHKEIAGIIKSDSMKDRVVSIKGHPRQTDLSRGLLVSFLLLNPF